MKIEIIRRNPAIGYTTIVVNGTNNVFTEEQYTDIIKSCSKIDGTGTQYIEARNKLLVTYFSNKPKKQFSW